LKEDGRAAEGKTFGELGFYYKMTNFMEARPMKLLFSFWLFLFASFVPISVTFSVSAEMADLKTTHPFVLEISENLISLKAEKANFRHILKVLENKTGIKIWVSADIPDHDVSIEIKSIPIYAIGTILEKMSLKNFAVLYETNQLSAFILPEGQDISEFTKGKAVINQSAFARIDPTSIKGGEIISVLQGKNKVPIRYVKDEILLKFHLGVSEDEINALQTKFNLVKAEDNSLSKIGYVNVRIPDGRDVIEIIKEIRKEHTVKFPEPNYIAEVLTINDPLYGDQWYIPATRFDEAWEKAKNTNIVKIAIIDSGVDGSHSDLDGKILQGYDFVNNDTDPTDDHGHGTFAAGIVAATSNDIGIKGLYDYARIIPVKVIDASGYGTYEDIARGIIYAVDNGAKVINLSVGGYSYSFMLQDAVDYALVKGCVVIAAAGNDGIEQVIYPAAYPDVIGVSALDHNDQIWSHSNSGWHIDITAPGVNIISTGLADSYVYTSGTSASTPMVSALAGLLISEKADLSSSYIARLMVQSANDLGDKGTDKIYGSGVIDALQAVKKKVRPFHDVAVKRVTIEPLVFEKGKPTYVVADIVNTGTYKSEQFGAVLYQIAGDEKKEIGRQEELVVINKTKVAFEWNPDELMDNIHFEVVVLAEKDTYDGNNSKETYTYILKEEDDLYVLYKTEPPVHQWIALNAWRKLPDGPLKAEMAEHLPTDENAYWTNWLGKKFYYYGPNFKDPLKWAWLDFNNNEPGYKHTALIEGVWEEDHGWRGIHQRWCNHFWTPNVGYNDGFEGLCIGVSWKYDSSLNTAQEESFVKALDYYPSNLSKSYYWLGRAAHLLMDMSVPEHVLNDTHISIPYIFPGFGYERYTGDHYKNITNASSNTDIPDIFSLDDYPLFTPPSFDNNLTKLFYNLADYANDFDSNDRNGKSIKYGGGKFRHARNQLAPGRIVSRVELWHVLVKSRDMVRGTDYDYYNNDCEDRIYYYEDFYHYFINNQLLSVKVIYDDGSSDMFFQLDDNIFHNIWDEPLECIYQPNLQSRAIGSVAALYQLFWEMIHDDDNDGYTEHQGDCDDTVNTVYPDAPELCDGFDNNCDGFIDEGLGVDFEDIQQGYWAESYIKAIACDGITTGYGDGTYKPTTGQKWLCILSEQLKETLWLATAEGLTPSLMLQALTGHADISRGCQSLISQLAIQMEVINQRRP
jgi:subtilisin family serine protease